MSDPASPFPITAASPWWFRRAGLLSWIGATLLLLAASGILFFLVHARDDVVILRYNAYLGIDLLGVWWQIFLVPAVAYFFVLANTALVFLLNRRGYPEAAWLMSVGNWFIAAATLVVAAALSFINV